MRPATIAFPLCLLLLLSACHAASQATTAARSSRPSTWRATDTLNRSLPTAPLAPPPQHNVSLGIFYMLWSEAGMPGPYDNSALLAAAGGDRRNVSYGPAGAFHHWGEPAFGYYLSRDEFVIRKHAQLLTDAGVDWICFDVTNALTYDAVWTTILDVFLDMRSHGSRTPQVAFIAYSSAPAVVQHLYDVLYSKPGQYEPLLFKWQGRPLILTNGSAIDPAIRDAFTFRMSWAWTQGAEWFGDGRDRWPWADWYPQGFGWHESPAVREQMPVMVAGWPVSNVGRSTVAGPDTEPPFNETQPALGHYFRMQFSHALNRSCEDRSFTCTQPQPDYAPPQALFVTGWNEWIAMRFIQGSQGCVPFIGQDCIPGDSYFVDEYIQEFSRDAEPMRGGHEDNFYYQLVSFARYYKGVDTAEPPSPPRSINVTSTDFTQWQTVRPVYHDDEGDTAHRDYPGFGDRGLHYTDSSCQDDLCDSRVAVDDSSVYFFLSSCSGGWRRGGDGTFLFIGWPHTGWYGWRWMVTVQSGRFLLWQHTGNYTQWQWSKARELQGTVGDAGQLHLALGTELMTAGGPHQKAAGVVAFEWKWWNADTAGGYAITAPVDFMLHGDAAPNARFNYYYESQHTTTSQD